MVSSFSIRAKISVMRCRLEIFKTKVVICLVMVLALSRPVVALTKIIIVPTAHTLGAGRYLLEFNHKAPLINAQSPTEDVTTKVGLGGRWMLEVKYPVKQDRSGALLFYAKYAFATANHGLTAAAIGVDHVGANTASAPFLVFSHYFKPMDITVGLARGRGGVTRYLAGVDYRIGDKLHMLSDWDSGTDDFASAGFQYQISPQWGVKTGFEIPRSGDSSFLLKIMYGGEY